MILRLVLALYLVLPGSLAAGAEAPELKVSWEPARPDIGDIVLLTVELTVPESHLVTFPRLDQNAVGFTVTGRLPTEPEKDAVGTRKWRQVYRLELERTGEIALPDIRVIAHDPATLVETVAETTGLAIPVAARAADVTDLRAITAARGTVEMVVERPDRTNFFVATLLAVLIAAISLVWWLRRRPDSSPGIAELPRDAALRALEGLDAEQNERFHADLAQVVRTYLDRALGVGAPRQTTPEALAALRACDVETQLLETTLLQCDQVKFARALPGRESRHRVLAAAMSFVGATEAS